MDKSRPSDGKERPNDHDPVGVRRGREAWQEGVQGSTRALPTLSTEGTAQGSSNKAYRSFEQSVPTEQSPYDALQALFRQANGAEYQPGVHPV